MLKYFMAYTIKLHCSWGDVLGGNKKSSPKNLWKGLDHEYISV